MTYHLALITHPSHPDTYIKSFLSSLNQSYEELSLEHPGLHYLARRMREEKKSAPALIYRNQIISTPDVARARQALQDWQLLELSPRIEEL